MKNELNLKGIFLSTTFILFLLGCSSSDDGDPGNSEVKRTEINMPLPTGNADINWNNAELVWSEEFGKSTLIDDIWNLEKNSNNPDVADQLQTYQRENLEISNGTLKIHANKVGDGQQKGDYTSARINTKYAYKYGRIEVSVKLPEAQKKGIWAKIVLIGENEKIVGWPSCGEIDLMEYFSYIPNKTFVNLHSEVNNSMNGTLISASANVDNAEEEFNAYGILWTDKYIKFYINDVNNIIYTFNRPSQATEENWPFNDSFYLLADMVVGGKYGGAEGVDDSLFPAAMEINYIRVYHAQ